MLQGLVSFLFSTSCIFLILIILVQKGKSSIGMGTLGGGSQMLFGSSGGQDIFQKITWVLGTILLGGSLGLAVWRSQLFQASAPVRNSPITQQAPALPLTDNNEQ